MGRGDGSILWSRRNSDCRIPSDSFERFSTSYHSSPDISQQLAALSADVRFCNVILQSGTQRLGSIWGCTGPDWRLEGVGQTQMFAEARRSALLGSACGCGQSRLERAQDLRPHPMGSDRRWMASRPLLLLYERNDELVADFRIRQQQNRWVVYYAASGLVDKRIRCPKNEVIVELQNPSLKRALFVGILSR